MRTACCAASGLASAAPLTHFHVREGEATGAQPLGDALRQRAGSAPPPELDADGHLATLAADLEGRAAVLAAELDASDPPPSIAAPGNPPHRFLEPGQIGHTGPWVGKLGSRSLGCQHHPRGWSAEGDGQTSSEWVELGPTSPTLELAAACFGDDRAGTREVSPFHDLDPATGLRTGCGWSDARARREEGTEVTG